MATEESYVLAIGTKKGLWLATSQDRQTWSMSGPHFLMSEVPSIGIDTRNGRTRIMVGVRSEHWGPTVAHSDDLGATWTEPEQGAIKFPEGTDAAVERIWQIYPDAESRPGVVWAGAEPISVWKSTDGGEHFELNRGLWDHPHRSEWGAGYGGAAAHSIVVNPSGDNVHVAMSTGGVYRSLDGGTSWEPRNKGISAYFMPDPNPEFGQCVHKIAADSAVEGRLYAQNHHGVYRTDDNGENWESIAAGLPADFGFVMLTHPRRAGTAWVIPLKADGERIPPDGKLAVHRTDDAGKTWKRLDSGLPQGEYNAVLRDAASVDSAEPAGVYFGTRGGSVYASPDEGEHFTEVVSHLPDVLCVRAAVVSAALVPGAPVPA
jgi:hypothetical protein